MKARERYRVMGSKIRFIIRLIFSLTILLRLIEGMDDHDHDHDRVSLDDFIQDFARKSLPRPRTGKLYNISLPGNFSGMGASMVRVRTGSFWQRGGNFSFFHFPPNILPTPSVIRLDIVITNLGNWSSSYFNVPNYTFVTPVIGFMTYGARNGRENGTLPLSLRLSGDSILVRFSQINVTDNTDDHKHVLHYKCATFGPAADTKVVLSNVTARNGCMVRDQGHFSIVVPVEPVTPAPAPAPAPTPAPANGNGKKGREKLWKWWVIGFAVGVVGLLLIGLILFIIIKFIRMKRIGKMERQSERSEALDTTWVGRSRMPSAAVIRTQPALENDYFP